MFTQDEEDGLRGMLLDRQKQDALTAITDKAFQDKQPLLQQIADIDNKANTDRTSIMSATTSADVQSISIQANPAIKV